MTRIVLVRVVSKTKQTNTQTLTHGHTCTHTYIRTFTHTYTDRQTDRRTDRRTDICEPAKLRGRAWRASGSQVCTGVWGTSLARGICPRLRHRSVWSRTRPTCVTSLLLRPVQRRTPNGCWSRAAESKSAKAPPRLRPFGRDATAAGTLAQQTPPEESECQPSRFATTTCLRRGSAASASCDLNRSASTVIVVTVSSRTTKVRCQESSRVAEVTQALLYLPRKIRSERSCLI